MATSKYQNEILKIVQFKYGKDNVYSNIRPKWLKNVQTNKAMELDIFVPLWNLSIEVNGDQHYKSVDFFSRTSVWTTNGCDSELIGTRKNNNALEELKFRDKQKKIICEYLGINLFVTNSDYNIDELYDYLQTIEKYNHNVYTLADFWIKSLCAKYYVYQKLFEELLTKEEYKKCKDSLRDNYESCKIISICEPEIYGKILEERIYDELEENSIYDLINNLYLSNGYFDLYNNIPTYLKKKLNKLRSLNLFSYFDGFREKNVVYDFIPYPSFGKIDYYED